MSSVKNRFYINILLICKIHSALACLFYFFSIFTYSHTIIYLGFMRSDFYKFVDSLIHLFVALSSLCFFFQISKSYKAWCLRSDDNLLFLRSLKKTALLLYSISFFNVAAISFSFLFDVKYLGASKEFLESDNTLVPLLVTVGNYQNFLSDLTAFLNPSPSGILALILGLSISRYVGGKMNGNEIGSNGHLSK